MTYAMVHLDTSIVVDALAGARRSAPALRRAIEDGRRMQMSAVVLYEWLRGPRREVELEDQETLFPASGAVPFDAKSAALAARLHARLPRGRGREIDLAIAACAIVHDASLWTLNRSDFSDIPGLKLF